MYGEAVYSLKVELFVNVLEEFELCALGNAVLRVGDGAAEEEGCEGGCYYEGFLVLLWPWYSCGCG